MADAAILQFVMENWNTIAGSALGAELLLLGLYERYYNGPQRKKLQDKSEKLQLSVVELEEKLKAYKRDHGPLLQKQEILNNRYNELDKLIEDQDNDIDKQHAEIRDIRHAWEQSAIRDNKRYSDMQALREIINNKQVHIDYIKEKIEALEIQMNKTTNMQQETLMIVAEIKGSFK